MWFVIIDWSRSSGLLALAAPKPYQPCDLASPIMAAQFLLRGGRRLSPLELSHSLSKAHFIVAMVVNALELHSHHHHSVWDTGRTG